MLAVADLEGNEMSEEKLLARIALLRDALKAIRDMQEPFTSEYQIARDALEADEAPAFTGRLP